MASGEPFDLAAALVDDGQITADQLEHCERVRQKLKQPRSVESVLAELGFLYRRSLRSTYERRGRRVPLGMILVESGAAPPDAIDRALAAQAQGDERRIGELLVAEQAIDEAALLAALADQQGLPLLSADPVLIDRSLMGRASLAFLKRICALPCSEGPSAITVLFAEPPRSEVVEELAGVLGRAVAVALAPRGEILAVLETAPTPLSIRADAAEAPALADSLLERAVTVGASDLHIEPLRDRIRVRYRIDGVLETRHELPFDVGSALVGRLKHLADLDVAEHRRPQEGRFTRRFAETEIDVRLSVAGALHGEHVALRLLRRRQGILHLDELGMAPFILRRFREEVLDAPTGTLLITGPVGAGKTATLYAAAAYSNRPHLKMISVESPVEFPLDGVVQYEVGGRGQGFAEALHTVLSQDPDVVVLGEVGDAESAHGVVRAALTGHKVYTTVHTDDSITGLLALTEFGVAPSQIAATVACVVAQRLLRKVCSDCRVPYTATRDELRRLGLLPQHVEGHALARGRGCTACRGTGYRGRFGVHELLRVDDPIQEGLYRGASPIEIRKLALANAAFASLREVAVAQALRGMTTLSEVLENTPLHRPERAPTEVLAMLEFGGGKG